MLFRFEMLSRFVPMARQSPDRSCIAPQILKTSEDLKQHLIRGIEIFANATTRHLKILRDIEIFAPAHEEEDEGDDAEDDDDDGQPCEHCCSSERIRYVYRSSFDQI